MNSIHPSHAGAPRRRGNRAIDMAGKELHGMRVLRLDRRRTNPGGDLFWLVRCHCGRRFSTSGTLLRSGRSKSCGCGKATACAAAATTHGHSHGKSGLPTPEYVAWQGMIRRCGNPRERCFPRYGGRGIRVCDLWRASFEAFLADMGPRPSSSHSVDRVNNDGHYEPGNCRWATRREQALNRRNTLRAGRDGQPVASLAIARGLPPSAVLQRLRSGHSLERALETPLRVTRRTRRPEAI